MDKTFSEDLAFISKAEFIPWEQLRDKTIFVTGATGLVGYSLISALLYANERRSLGLHVLALVRDIDRAHSRFEEQKDCFGRSLSFVSGSVERLPEIQGPVDYIVHGASQTSSKAFVEQPVETIRTAIDGTISILELAREKQVKGFVYLSSMEVYGYPEKGHKVTESDIGTFSPLELRNSYPLSKVQCESLCYAYGREYGVPAKIVRLTQTFGPGVNYNDGRIFAYFGRCMREKQDIVLKTRGETERSYLYTRDAATAILTVLLKGEPGQVYNAADEDTYCSIAEMARKIADRAGVNVRFDIQPEGSNGFPNTLYMDLDTSKLKSLGWIVGGGYDLVTMIERMLSGVRVSEKEM
ncbi:MAG: NAD(P)-dependent oxidoreductase [Oscillospiraceae bacterium]|nr:NAD(P)-dependent oxidoreductase [Oscillospiraceae bacterium]